MFTRFRNRINTRNNYNGYYNQNPINNDMMDNPYNYEINRLEKEINELKRQNNELSKRLSVIESYLGMRNEINTSNNNY